MTSSRRAALVFLVALFALFVGCGVSLVHAQGGPRIVALEDHEAAPFAGMLIPDDELVAWRREIERLRFELVLIQQRADALRAADATLAEASRRVGDERLALREELWTERATSLTRERDEARSRQGPRWWQRGSLWFPVGLAVGAVIGVVAATR